MRVYGRLDVFWPDGKFESFNLNQPTTTVGRAPGNSVTLDSDNVSRYHFSIMLNDDAISITDLGSSSGTVVDGLRLPSNTQHSIEDTAEIQVGQLRMFLHAFEASPTLPMRALLGDETQRIERQDLKFQLHLEKTRLSVWPAANNSVEISITNTGTKPRRFGVMTVGLEPGWVRVNRPEVEVQPEETATLLINVKPSRRPSTQPGQYPLTVIVQAKDAPEAMLEGQITVDMQPYVGFGMALARRQISLNAPVRLFLHNQGNAALRLHIAVVNPAGAVTAQLSAARVQLNAGERQQITGFVRALRRPLIGREKQYHLDVQVRSEDQASFIAAERLYVAVKPMLAPWMVVAISGLVLMLAIGLLLAGLGLRTLSTRPQIEDFAVSSTQVAQGDPLVLSWNADRVERLEVMVNQTPVATLAGDRQSVEVDTRALLGTVNLSVSAYNGDHIATVQPLRVNVYQPVTIETFSVTPAQLVRNVVSTLNVIWNAPGAIRTRISGLEDFTNAPLETEHGASAALSGISGIPDQPLTLVLVAEDAAGNTLEQRISIELVAPSCTAIGAVPLREGPDERHQTIATVPNGTAVVIDARDASGGWLRTEIAGTTGWARPEDFSCDGRFAIEDLRQEANIPPTPTLTPTATSSPTPSITPTVTATRSRS